VRCKAQNPHLGQQRDPVFRQSVNNVQPV